MEQSNLVENEELEYSCSWRSDTMGTPNLVANTTRRNINHENDEGPAPDISAIPRSEAGQDQEIEIADVGNVSLEGRRDLVRDFLKEQWETNYKEAAIFLEEGINNDKFTHHPRSREELPAYLLVHNNWFHLIDLGAALLLLALGFVESPCYDSICIPTQIHSSIELCLLFLVTCQVYMKTRWIGWRTFVRHKRTMIKFITLAVMLVEALVVLVRSNSHFRVSRALRPIFLIDNYFCGGVRRFIRQVLQSLTPIFDMLALVFFVMLIYSVFGFFLFGKVDPENFGNLRQSFISLFVLVTTANFPDVMMRSYNASRWSALFFVSYLLVNLYFLMNLMLAVVYDAFTRIEKEKFRRLFLHKRKAAQHCFNLLVTKERPNEISFVHFEGLLRAFKGISSSAEAYLIFKLLNKSKSGYLTIDEFYDIYDACLYSWNFQREEPDWFHDMWHPLQRVFRNLKRLVLSTWFEIVVCFFVVANGMILLVQTWIMTEPSSKEAQSLYAPWVTYFFVGLYTIEAVLKLFGLGIVSYFSSYWNIFDFTVTTMGIASLIMEYLHIPLFYVVILRPLRLLTLFRMKKRFRDVFGTAVILFPRLTSAMIVLLLIYYFFGMIGMECFHSFSLYNCCKNTSVEQYFKFEEGSGSNAYFYENNFNGLLNAFVTLFELTVVNNWHVIMEGYANVTETDWSRLFFMIFYVFTMIVMTIIVAFILEAFLFRIQFKELLTKHEEQKKLTAEITLTAKEAERIISRSRRVNQQSGIEGLPPREAKFTFVGQKTRTKEQLQMLMYAEEMETWIAQTRQEEANNQARIRAALLQIEPSQNRENSNNAEYFASEPVEEMVRVVDEDDGPEITTIQRTVLPDMHRAH